MKPNGLS